MLGEKLSDRYEIIAELGRGGMGVVYRAHDPLLDRDVAVKVIPPALLTSEIEKRFQSEAQLVAQMEHPSIVSIYDFGRHEDSLFFVMPIVEGESLRRCIRRKSLVLGDIVEVGAQVAEVLEYSHRRGVIHRDIKPENIMVYREDEGPIRVHVMDFGLALGTRASRVTKTGILLGTVSYVSPEQVKGESVDGRSDIYSLGTVLYECVVGEVPFTGETQSVLYRIHHEFPRSPHALGVEIDGELEGIILACLAKRLDERPDTGADLARSLRRYRAQLRDSERRRTFTATRSLEVQRPPVSPFVGREKEFKELQTRLNAAIAGECQFVVVSGEPGIGKTRLLDELETLAGARQIRVLHGRFVERDSAFPYHGFCEAIQEYFRQKEVTSLSSALPDFSDIADDLIALFPMLGEIDTIRAASSGAIRLDESAEYRWPEDRTRIFELLARTLTRLEGSRPLLLFLEDLHGAEASLEALPYIVRRLGPTPTLIVATYRSTEVHRRHPLLPMLEGFRGDRRFASIQLGPFSPSEHRLFLSTLVGGTEIADDVVEKLFDGTEGNPFFTKELVRSLLDAGNIVRNEAGTWTLSGGTGISAEALPATIQEAVERRLGNLPDDMRRLLSVAAVMGKTFNFRDLETLAAGHDDLDDAMDRLVQEGLIEEDRRSRGYRLAFCSGVVREVLYAELSRRRRTALHRKYADILERRHSGRLERVYPQLVHHAAEGDAGEKAVEYGLLHARSAIEAFSPKEAIRSAKTALEFLDDEWLGERALEAEARMLLGAAHQMSGDVSPALKEFDTAVKIFAREGRQDREAGALLIAARTAWQARQTEATRQRVERGIEVARAARETETLERLLSLAITLANLRGEYVKASSYLEESRALVAAEEETDAGEGLPQGGRLIVAFANPLVAREPFNMGTIEEAEFFANVFETLLATDAEGNLVPALCERWEADEPGESFLLSLRADVVFQDGQPLTAAAVKKSFERSIRRATTGLRAAFAPIRGAAALANDEAAELEGVTVRTEYQLEIRLEEPLPIYPALLADPGAAITQAAAGSGDGNGADLLGTGPFLPARSALGSGAVELEPRASHASQRLVLDHSPRYWGTPPRLDGIEFRTGLASSAIAAGLRSGEIDLARDLLPRDLEEIQRDPRFRGGLVETPAKNTYFILFNVLAGPLAQNPAARRALAGAIRTRDLVWSALGRFAQPAAGLLPPGILGHDPGKRGRLLSMEEAQELLRSAELPAPVHLRAAVHPLIQDRYGSLLQALLAVWSELGVEVSIETPDMESFVRAWSSSALDFCAMRWVADYDDPDNFTHTLFHSSTGLLRGYYCSDEADRLMDEARAESRATAREGLYRRLEDRLLETHALIPLFHDVDYRVASSKVRGLELRSSMPPVNYVEIGKTDELPARRARPEVSGVLRVPMSAEVRSLAPASVRTSAETEVISTVYETLIRDVGEAQIVPWLAESFDMEEGGRRYGFLLRDDVRFHDGRRLTARDVRYSLERLLQSGDSSSRWLSLPVQGTRELLAGQATELSGFHIRSAREFTIELEKPLSFFLALLTYPAAAVIPEGSTQTGRSWQEGTVGTGPFRVTRFEPGLHLELERNPSYWRDGYPRSRKLEFSFGITPQEIMSGFRAGRFSLAGDLYPSDVEALRREPRFATGYREAPALSTCHAALNMHRGPLTDVTLRRKLVRAINVEKLVSQALGQIAIPSHGLIPPGLLGYEPGHRAALFAEPLHRKRESPVQIELTAAVHPVFAREHAGLYDGIVASLRKIGVNIRQMTETMDEFTAALQQSAVDLVLARWIADYADADAFAHILHTREGRYGRICGTAEIDELIEKGCTETDPEARHSIYRQIEEVLARESCLLPLFHEQDYRFARPEIEGLSISYCFSYDTLKVRDQ